MKTFFWIFGFEWWGGLRPAAMTTASGARYAPLVWGLWVRKLGWPVLFVNRMASLMFVVLGFDAHESESAFYYSVTICNREIILGWNK